MTYSEQDLGEMAKKIAETDAEREWDYSEDLRSLFWQHGRSEKDGVPAISMFNLLPKDRRFVRFLSRGVTPGKEAAFLTGVDVGFVIALILQKLGRFPFTLPEEEQK